MIRRDKILIAVETYLNLKDMATSRQISSFLSNSSLSLGSAPTPAEIGRLLGASKKFQVVKIVRGRSYFAVK